MIFAPLKGSLARPWTSIAKTVPWRNRSATATRGTDVLLQSNPLLAPLENAACDEELPRPSLCKWHLMVQDLPWLKLAGWSQQWYCDTVIQIHMIHTTDTADLLCPRLQAFPSEWARKPRWMPWPQLRLWPSLRHLIESTPNTSCWRPHSRGCWSVQLHSAREP